MKYFTTMYAYVEIARNVTQLKKALENIKKVMFQFRTATLPQVVA